MIPAACFCFVGPEDLQHERSWIQLSCLLQDHQGHRRAVAQGRRQRPSDVVERVRIIVSLISFLTRPDRQIFPEAAAKALAKRPDGALSIAERMHAQAAVARAEAAAARARKIKEAREERLAAAEREREHEAAAAEGGAPASSSM